MFQWRTAVRGFNPPHYLKQGLPVALIIGTFLFACSAMIDPFVRPLNCDEVDTSWSFCFQQYDSQAAPWKMGSSYSGMYNLTFWLRTLPFGVHWFREHSAEWNRMYNLLATLVLLLIVYGFARWMKDHLYGVIVLFIAAFAHYSFFISLEGNYLNETAAACLATLWIFLVGERSKTRNIQIFCALLTILGAAVCWMLYFSGRLIGLGLLSYCIVRVIENRNWLRQSWPNALSAVLIVIAGLAQANRELIENPAFAQYRQRDTQLLVRPQLEIAMNDYSTDSVAVLAARNIAASFRAYYTGPNNYHAYTTPYGFLDPISFWLFLAGAVWILWRWRQPAFLLLIICFLIHNAILGGLTMYPYPPYHQRVHVGIMSSYFAVAIPVWALARLPIRWNIYGQFAGGILLGILTFLNARIYFDRVLDDRDPYLVNHLRCEAMADYLYANAGRYVIVTANEGSASWDFDTLMCHHNAPFRRGFPPIQPYSDWKTAPGRENPDGRPLLFVVQDPIHNGIEAEIESQFRGGRWLRLAEDGSPSFKVYISPTLRGTPGRS